ncbi:LytR/AlgR family response regulator transcription factor [Sphingobacterium faecale]|uniref:Response regulator transcription factor n=1 Tax=Sphingobacterium faecale TaxID=2803775 RepID=A0ABS1R162_9SPHI|nr:LytTR family DNA-binding domain-containing protein [Sphingobacterium faecale]MBL1408210.1 response regulator transcription factor [Sphingobacterium faecale]
MMINCIIIDDEQHAIDVTKHYCGRVADLDVRSTFTDPTAAVAYIEANGEAIDLVFLDIEMPRFSGLDFLKAYDLKNVVLVTAYSDFALDSYRYGVVDYLLKPFSFERFCLAINKVSEKIERNKKVSEDVEKEPRSLCLKLDRQKYVKLAYEDIKYIQAAQNYSVIYTMTEQIIVPFRLQEVQKLLPSERFPRIHKSHIIHMDYFEILDGKTIKLKATDRHLLLGPTYKQEFLKIINIGRD